MDIFLIPYNASRHLAMGWIVGAAALLLWFGLILTQAVIGPMVGLVLSYRFETFAYLGGGAALIAATSVYAECVLRKQGALFRIVLPVVALLLAFICSGSGAIFFEILHRVLASDELTPLLDDPSFTSFHHRLGQWVSAGLSAGFGALVARWGGHFLRRRGLGLLDIEPDPTLGPFVGYYDHLAGGLASGLFGAVAWHMLGYYGIPIPSFIDPAGRYLILPDLYVASAAGLLVWGTTFGWLAWGVPDDMYAGWIRVLSKYRYGHRIPVTRRDGKSAERFVGHYPRGLDVHLPAEQGVAELHASFFVSSEGAYTVRGLSQYPLLVKRSLEKVDLRYDPNRPAPLETDLKSDDILILSAGNARTELEFVMLPKEEI